MKTKASIDIGSNSTLLLVAREVNGELKVLCSESRVTGLGRDLDKNGAFIQESMDDTFDALKEYCDLCKGFAIKPEDIIITATEASRVAKNSSAFYQRVKESLSLDVKIISSQAEAYYSARGVAFDSIPEKEIIIMDIGGASTELIKVGLSPFEVKNSVSLPFGAVRMTGWIKEGIKEQKLKELFTQFKIDDFSVKKLYCVAGTMTSVANMFLGHQDFIEQSVHNAQLSFKDLINLYEKFNDYTPEQYLEQFPFLGKRSQTIKGGLCVAKEVLERIQVENIIVSTYGLRYGTLLEGKIKDEFITRR